MKNKIHKAVVLHNVHIIIDEFVYPFGVPPTLSCVVAMFPWFLHSPPNAVSEMKNSRRTDTPSSMVAPYVGGPERTGLVRVATSAIYPCIPERAVVNMLDSCRQNAKHVRCSHTVLSI